MIKNIELEKGAYQFDAKMPLRQAIPLGLQHVFAMFVGNLTPLLIITSACGIAGGEFADLQVSLLQNAMFVAGVVTLVQLFSIGPVGGQVPIIMGTSSGFLGVFNSVAASMGGGVVSATVDGKHMVKAITIDPEAVDPDDVEMLQDMVIAAVNEAIRNAMDDMSASMGKITGGMNLPF